MEHDETSKLADVQTKPADLADLADMDEPAEPAAVVKTTEPSEPAAATKAATRAAKTTKNPKRVEQGKRLAEWNKANKRRQLEPALKQASSSTPEPALEQLEASTSPTPKSSFETKGDTKDYFLIGETILIIGLLSVGIFCYTTSLTFNKADKAQLEDATSGQAQLELSQPEAGVKRSKKSPACRNSVEKRQYF